METNESEQQNDKQKTRSQLKKTLILGLFVLFFVTALLVWIGNNIDSINKRVYDWRAQRYVQSMKEYEDKMIALYTADKDGGKTPEETIDLFIAALKAGDVEQASKYFVIEKQQEEALFLRNMLQTEGSLQKSIDFYLDLKKNGQKKCNEELNACVLEYLYVSTSDRLLEVKGRSEKILIPAGEKSLRSESFSVNKYSNVWKIKS